MERLPRSRGDTYALSALRKKRAELASELVQLERQTRHRREALGHVDATLRLLDPSVDIEAIPNKRIVRRIKLFRQGELGRLILGALRDAEAPLSTQAITSEIIAAGGHGESSRPALMPRVRGNLAYLHRREKVIKSGNGKATRWQLA
jgi:hypothetical protein